MSRAANSPATRYRAAAIARPGFRQHSVRKRDAPGRQSPCWYPRIAMDSTLSCIRAHPDHCARRCRDPIIHQALSNGSSLFLTSVVAKHHVSTASEITSAAAENQSRCTSRQCSACNAAIAVAKSTTIAMRQGNCTFHSSGAFSQTKVDHDDIKNQAIAISTRQPHNFFVPTSFAPAKRQQPAQRKHRRGCTDKRKQTIGKCARAGIVMRCFVSRKKPVVKIEIRRPQFLRTHVLLAEQRGHPICTAPAICRR